MVLWCLFWDWNGFYAIAHEIMYTYTNHHNVCIYLYNTLDILYLPPIAIAIATPHQNPSTHSHHTHPTLHPLATPTPGSLTTAHAALAPTFSTYFTCTILSFAPSSSTLISAVSLNETGGLIITSFSTRTSFIVCRYCFAFFELAAVSGAESEEESTPSEKVKRRWMYAPAS